MPLSITLSTSSLTAPHQAAEHRVVVGNDQHLDQRRTSELPLGLGHELRGGRFVLEHVPREAQRQQLAWIERRLGDLVVGNRADLLLVDSDQARDLLVLNPLVLGFRRAGDGRLVGPA